MTEEKIRVYSTHKKCFTGFAVYVHKRADTEEPFYYGCGGKYRPTTMTGRPASHIEIAKKHGVIVEIIAIFDNKDSALEEETKCIQQAIKNGENIVNIVDDHKTHCKQIAKLGGQACVDLFKSKPKGWHRNWYRKLTNEQILEIREKFVMKNKRESNATKLGIEYGVDKSTILRVAKLESWRTV